MLSLYVAAWTASIMSGVAGVVGKLTSKYSVSNPWLLNFFWGFFILIGFLVLSLYYGIDIPKEWTYIVWASLAYALMSTTYTLAMYKLDVSVMAPMFAFRTAIAVLFGTLFLGEILTTNQYILILIIFIAGIFVNLDEQFKLKSFFNRWVAVLLACMFFLVLQAVFVKKSVPINGLWNTTFWMALLGQVWLLGTIRFFKNDIVSTTKKQYGSIVILALIGIVVVVTENMAYAGNVSISAVIISLPISMVLAFLLSRFMPELLEKHTLKIYAIRFIAAAIMITAALKL